MKIPNILYYFLIAWSTIFLFVAVYSKSSIYFYAHNIFIIFWIIMIFLSKINNMDKINKHEIDRANNLIQNPIRLPHSNICINDEFLFLLRL